MKQLFSLLLLILLSSLFSETALSKRYHYESIVRYDYLGSYKALLGIPKGKGPFPVIIYSYDEFQDWAGPTLAERQGYNLKKIANYYTNKGYVTVIPLERYRKVNTIVGVTQLLRNKPYVQKNNIHLIGVSEGALLSVIAANKIENVTSITLIAPIPIHDKGHLSKDFYLINKVQQPKIPILILFAKDVAWRIKAQKKAFHLIQNKYSNIQTKSYTVKKRWFWSTQHKFNKDINLFIMKHYNHHHARQNTYKSPQYQPSL